MFALPNDVTKKRLASTTATEYEYTFNLPNSFHQDYDSNLNESQQSPAEVYEEYYTNNDPARPLSLPLVDSNCSKPTDPTPIEVVLGVPSPQIIQIINQSASSLLSSINDFVDSNRTGMTNPNEFSFGKAAIDADLGVNVVFNNATPRQHLCSADVDASWSQWERVLLLICGLSAASLVAILNVCVIFTFIKCPEIRLAPQNLYILNLAICDFCVGVNSLPGVTIYFSNMCWPFSVPLCQVMTTVDWITSTETGVSMCLVAYDRLRLVRLGALYHQRENRRVVAAKILWSWLLVITLLSPGILMPFYTGVSVNAHGDCVNEIYQVELLGTALTSITGILPPLTLAFIYYAVYCEMRANRRFNNEREAQRQRRAARGMYFLCAIFLASWIPTTMHELAVALIHKAPSLHKFKLNPQNEYRIMTFFKFWIYINSLVNPFLYAFAFRAIRAAMEKTFLCAHYHRKLDQRRLHKLQLEQISKLGYNKNVIKLEPVAVIENDEHGSVQTIRDWSLIPIKPSSRKTTMFNRSAHKFLAKSISVEATISRTHSVPDIVAVKILENEGGERSLPISSPSLQRRPNRSEPPRVSPLALDNVASTSIKKSIKFFSATTTSTGSNISGYFTNGTGNGSVANNSSSRFITLAAINYSTFIMSPNNPTATQHSAVVVPTATDASLSEAEQNGSKVYV